MEKASAVCLSNGIGKPTMKAKGEKVLFVCLFAFFLFVFGLVCFFSPNTIPITLALFPIPVFDSKNPSNMKDCNKHEALMMDLADTSGKQWEYFALEVLEH